MVHDAHDGIVRLTLAARGLPDGQLYRILRGTAARNGWSIDVGDEEALLAGSDLIVATSIPPALAEAPADGSTAPLIVVVDALSDPWNEAFSASVVAALIDRHDLERRLPAALHAVLAGLKVIAPPPIRTGPPSSLVPRSSAGETAHSHTELSRAERAVYGALHRGLSNREIAEELDISVNTVKFHVSSIFAKLGVHNRTQAIVVAAHGTDGRPSTDAYRRAKFV